MDKKDKGMCFVIMPISDPEDYEEGHFKRVYDDIFATAIREAGYTPKRADDENSSTMIQANIVKDIINAPMAVCDLSTRNPNVLFELGIRQAFDLPVVLVQEKGTARIFDIASINTIDYDKNMGYRNVLETQKKITASIGSTEDKEKGVNSIIKLLKITKANMPEDQGMTEMDELRMLMYSMRNEMEEIRREMLKDEDIINPQNIRTYSRRNETYMYYHNKIQELRRMFHLSQMSDEEVQPEIRMEMNIESQKLMSKIETEKNISEREKKELMNMVLRIKREMVREIVI